MIMVSSKELDFDKGGGLIPVIVQDYESKEVLTLAYANNEALRLTQKTGLAHFYRRSFNKVMMKGASSGHVQHVVSILADCDLDAMIYIVQASGPACHTGEDTCFYRKVVVECQ